MTLGIIVPFLRCPLLLRKMLEKIIATKSSSFMDPIAKVDWLIRFCCMPQIRTILLFRLWMLANLCVLFSEKPSIHKLLPNGLFKLGVSGIELQWSSNYLRDCKQQVKCGNQYSD